MKLSLSFTESEDSSGNILKNPVIAEILEKELEKLYPDSKHFESIEISISLVSSEKIQELNKTYRNVDEATDVLSFPLMGEEAVEVPELPVLALGDIVISPEDVKRLHKNLDFNEAMILMTVHSFLHLLGYDHDTEEKQEHMWQIQDEIKRKILEVIS